MAEIMNQPAQLATSSIPEDDLQIAGGLSIIRRGRFMLLAPQPATPLPDDVADLRAAREALDQPGERKPYDQVRRDLGIG
jgi:hypothetical protein